MKACCWLAALAALFAPVVALGDGDLVFETPWFDAGIAHYDSWPADGSDKEGGGAGVWSSTQVARLVGPQDERLLSVSAPKGTNLLFTTEAARSVTSEGLSFHVSAKFTARETSTKLFLPSATAKCALTVAKITEGGAAAYFGLAKDPSGATNSWLRLYGAEPVFDTEIALSFDLRSEDGGNFVRYTAGETALEDGAGNEWLPVVFADGDAGLINEVGYSGDGEVRSLSGFVKAGQEVVRIPLTIPEIAHVIVSSVTANGFRVEPTGGVYLVPQGSVVVVRFSAEAGYAITATEMEFTAGDAAMDLPTEGRPEVVVNPKPTDWAGLFRWNMLEEIFIDIQKADPEWNVVLLRYFNPIGAHSSGLIGEDPNGIPNNLMPYITQVAVGKRAELGVFGDDYDTPDGTGVRDYIHVVDLARGHVKALKAIEKKCGLAIYNLGTGHGYSVLDVVKAFEKANGVAVPYSIKPRRPGDIATCYSDPAKALLELGWKAEFGIEEMCRDSWNWQKNNPEGY